MKSDLIPITKFINVTSSSIPNILSDAIYNANPP